MKKVIRVTVKAEFEIETDWYYAQDSVIARQPEKADKLILDAEKENYQEWILDNIVSEKIELRNL